MNNTHLSKVDESLIHCKKSFQSTYNTNTDGNAISFGSSPATNNSFFGW
jgi:hypothetical protein